jgi:MFS family permease
VSAACCTSPSRHAKSILGGFFPTPWVIVVCGFIASATIGLIIPILYTLTAEHFPTEARTTGVAAPGATPVSAHHRERRLIYPPTPNCRTGLPPRSRFLL